MPLRISSFTQPFRRRPCASLVALVAAVFFCALTTAAHATQPNIVVILSDDAGYNELGFANDVTGYPTTNAVTPKLDALAAESVVMRQGYAAASLCTVARAGLLLGQYQQRFGVEENLSNNINAPYGIPGDELTLADRLKALGYTTQAIGKWHLGSALGVNRPQNSGFDEFYGSLGGDRGYFAGDGNPDTVIRHADANQDVSIESSWANPSNKNYAMDFLGQTAASYVSTHANTANPFFMYVSLAAPHTPWTGGPNANGTLNEDYNDVPEIAGITDPYDRITAALMHGLDRNVGSIISALKDPNHDGDTSDSVYENTMIVYVNDNGGVYENEPGNAHTMNQPFAGFKGHTLEGGIRIPYLIKAPGVAPGVYDAPVSTFDLMPTLVTAAGGDVAGENIPGVNLIPYLEGQTVGDPHEIMFWRNRNFWAVRRGDYKYCRPIESNFAWPYLFNLAATIVETPATNLVNSQPTIAAELQREFTYWEATLAKPLFGILGTDDRNHFDHFVFRNDVAASNTWAPTKLARGRHRKQQDIPRR